MLTNVQPSSELTGLARAKAKSFETRTVHTADLEEHVKAGWSVDKYNTKSVRLKREKSIGKTLEDRVWSLLYKTGFSFLSTDNGAVLTLNPKEENSAKAQIDVVGIDRELALAIECKASAQSNKRLQFAEELGKLALSREKFAHAVNEQFPESFKRQVVLAMFLWNAELNEQDKHRAQEANVVLFNNADLEYYESLSEHLGPAAKYQLFSDMIPGKPVQGLKIKVPAVKAKMGGSTCYSFSITPEYLLKISYVSHRSKGRTSDVGTYQRMMNKSRLRKIQQYITEDGMFPTNIVVNLEANRLTFQKVHQEGDSAGTQLGWLDIHPAYKSAWIIDGQHRVFAYSGHERASSSLLTVTAFEGLPASKQAELFIDINAKQKSVPQSLLEELYGDLHWDSDDPSIQVRAIVSRCVQQLGMDFDSPLKGRIQTADAAKDSKRCISLTSVYRAIERTRFFVAQIRDGKVTEFGPLWAGDKTTTLTRATFVLKRWIRDVSQPVEDWWNLGGAEGGGLAMNDGVTMCVNLLASVLLHLESQNQKPIRMKDDVLVESVLPYAKAVGAYLAEMTPEKRKLFRDLRGGQGQIVRTRHAQKALQAKFPDFNPPGLEEFLKQEKAESHAKAKHLVDRIELTLQRMILTQLQEEFGVEEKGWWLMGVPQPVRLKVTERFEREDGKRGGKEHYFDLSDYQKIAQQNWNLFEGILGYGPGQGKEKRTSWMGSLNEMRKIVAHASSSASLSPEELNELEQYVAFLNDKARSFNVLTQAAGAN